MRRKMTKMVKKTTIKMAVLEMVNGEPTAKALEDRVVLGNLSLEKAQRLMEKEIKGVTVLEVIPDTNIYEMEVEEFIKHATIKEENKKLKGE